MSTNKELESQVEELSKAVSQLQSTSSDIRDELVVLKNNYTKLVSELSTRLEVIHNRFQSS